MARGVSLQELNKWLKENEKHTWSLRDMAGWKEGSTHLIKYLDLGFDTRTMDVFRIGVRGACEDFSVHTSDDSEYGELKELQGKDNSLLDLLDYKIDNLLKKQRERK